MIKNIFDSEDSPEADKKFASAKAAELAKKWDFDYWDAYPANIPKHVTAKIDI